jgi:deoxyribonuclease V
MAYPWHTPASVEEAIAIQRELATRLLIRDEHGPIRTVAGVDAGFEGETARAAVVVLSFPQLAYLDHALARRPAGMPYVPGLLSFREAPAILAALEALRQLPDLLLLDGQGIAHPRRLGIAAHVGLITDLPAIGVAKSLLHGRHGLLGDERGATAELRDRGELIGVALRTRPGTKPLYISPGHRVGLDSAVRYVMACTTRYRLPETTRAAHNLASHGTLPPGAQPPQPEQGQLL